MMLADGAMIVIITNIKTFYFIFILFNYATGIWFSLAYSFFFLILLLLMLLLLCFVHFFTPLKLIFLANFPCFHRFPFFCFCGDQRGFVTILLLSNFFMFFLTLLYVYFFFYYDLRQRNFSTFFSLPRSINAISAFL